MEGTFGTTTMSPIVRDRGATWDTRRMIVLPLRRRALRVNGARHEIRPAPELLGAFASGRREVPKPRAYVPVGEVAQSPRGRGRPLGRWSIVRKHDDRNVGAFTAHALHGVLVLEVELAARDVDLASLLRAWVRAGGWRGRFRLVLPSGTLTGDLASIDVVIRRSRVGRSVHRENAAALDRLGIPADYGAKRQLPKVREPNVLAFADIDLFGRVQWLHPRAAAAWRRMRDAAREAGVVLQLVSAFRSSAYQVGLIERKLARGATIDDILEVNAAPGYSEHHAGRAIDIATSRDDALEERFESTPA